MPKVKFDGILKRCECTPRRWPKCVHSWHFGFHHGGQEHRFSLEQDRPRTRTATADE